MSKFLLIKKKNKKNIFIYFRELRDEKLLTKEKIQKHYLNGRVIFKNFGNKLMSQVSIKKYFFIYFFLLNFK